MKRHSLLCITFACSFLGCTNTAMPSSSEATVASNASSASIASSALASSAIPIARASLLAADAALANETTLRGINALCDALADDALLLARRQPLIVGRRSIVDYFAATPLGGALGWRYVRGDVSALGDFGYTLGWSEVFDSPDDAGTVAARFGIYVFVWRRHTSKWKIEALVRLDLTGPPAPAPPGLLPLTAAGPAFPLVRSADETCRELSETDAAFAALTAKVGRQKGFDAFVAEDGIQVDDPFIFGRRAIFDANASVPANSTLLWTPLHSHGAKSSDLGMTVGSYESHSFAGDGSPRVSYGKYLTVWRRDADGHWKFVLDGGNSGPAPSP